MENIKWRSTLNAIEVTLFLWFMASIAEIGVSIVVFIIFLTTKMQIMHIPGYIHLLAVLGIIIPGLTFKYFPTQED
jgi:hypothetical protein